MMIDFSTMLSQIMSLRTRGGGERWINVRPQFFYSSSYCTLSLRLRMLVFLKTISGKWLRSTVHVVYCTSLEYLMEPVMYFLILVCKNDDISSAIQLIQSVNPDSSWLQPLSS